MIRTPLRQLRRVQSPSLNWQPLTSVAQRKISNKKKATKRAKKLGRRATDAAVSAGGIKNPRISSSGPPNTSHDPHPPHKSRNSHREMAASSPSDELRDEIEALNSIYGDGTLVAAPSAEDPNTYILVLPPPEDDQTQHQELSLRISFPPTYPATEPPSVISTHSTGATAKPGAAARAVNLFRSSVTSAFAPGDVCLFDAVEEFRALAAAEAEAEADHQRQIEEEFGADEDAEGEGGAAGARRSDADADAAALSEPPPWVLSDPLTEQKSTFLARAARVSSPAQASSYIAHLLATDKRARAATHNITAWRIRGEAGSSATYQDCDDDGEAAAGGRVLRLLQLMDVWDVVVVVTRWYGGVKLGPRRFAVINTVAREAVVRASEGSGGATTASGSGGGKGGGKKKGK